MVKFSIQNVISNLSAWQITAYEKLFLYDVIHKQFLSVWILCLRYLKNGMTIMFKFSQYLWPHEEWYNNLFSLITQPWRHPGAILCFHMIIHIFITIHHKLPKFRVHMECDQTIKSHKNITWLCKWRSKVKSHFVLYLRNRWSNWAQILICCSEFSTRNMTFIFHFDDVIIVKLSIKGDNA